ncbi:MAG: hypothetical protein U1B78_08125 [Dehalococcoidia bacterium]|nr:hypothetical protein [Dehalococcoidia bacterium]
MRAIGRLFRDLAHLHIGQRGIHLWTRWRERIWCTYCGRDTSERT